MKLAHLAALATIALSGSALAQSLDPNAGETREHRDARMKWWREARFGMFIHWGLYAQLAGTWKGQRMSGIGEWIMHDLKIPIADYKPLAGQFNPVQFNADEWVSIAKAAGMKYIVMTSKHHEGFAMFHSSTDPFNIWDATPFKRDPIAEMGAACKKQGLKFGVYYSQAQDWNHPGGAAYGGHWDPAQDGDLHQYVQKVAVPQVAELLTKYKPAVLWWDTPVDMSPEDIRALTKHFKDVPGLIANNRLGNGVPGDTETPEQFIPATGYPGRDWETCMTMNDTWGYKSYDTNFKSTEMLLRNLIDIASKGGNYLLNVGPEPTGLIPGPEVDRLRQMGQWLKVNGASIYGTSASPYKRLPFNGRATTKGNSLFLNVFEWPSEGLVLEGLQTPIRSATVLATREKLKVTKKADGSLSISRPSGFAVANRVARDVLWISTAIELKLAARPVVIEPEFVIKAGAGGGFDLEASTATVEGTNAKLQDSGRNANIGYWTGASDTVSWKVKSESGGNYTLRLDYSCAPDSEGSTFEIEVDGKPTGIKGTIAKTASWDDYTEVSLEGTLALPAGTHVLKVVPRSKPGLAVMNLRRLTLKRE